MITSMIDLLRRQPFLGGTGEDAPRLTGPQVRVLDICAKPGREA